MFPRTPLRYSDRSRVTVPLFSFCAVMGVALLGLIYFAKDLFGPPHQLAVSTEFHGLPKPFRADPPVEILTVREAPVPEASPVQQALAQAPSQVVPSKKVAPKRVAFNKSGKKKAVATRTRPRSGSYAHVNGSNFPRM